MPTYADFDSAVSRLIGEGKYVAMRDSGYSRPDFCREVAQDAFIDALIDQPTQKEDLELVRSVAKNLWKGDGVTGLTED